MLNRVEIHEFRSCHGVVLDDLKPMTVLVGRNAVGKTNILRAIEWLASRATATDAPRQAGSVSLAASINSASYDYSVDFRFAPNSKGSRRALFSESLEMLKSKNGRSSIFQRRGAKLTISSEGRSIKIGSGIPAMAALASLMPADSPTLSLTNPFQETLERIRYYPLDIQDENDRLPIVTQESYEKWLIHFNATADPGTSALLRLLHLNMTNDPRFKEVCSLLGTNGLGLIDEIRVLRQTWLFEEEGAGPYWIDFRPTMSSRKFFHFQNLSYGTQRVIRLLVSFLFDAPAVMLLEHPEDGIHRGLVRKLIGVLESYSDQTQIIVSSHSPAVFNSLDPRAVRLVTMEDGMTKVRALNSKELQAATRFLEEEGSLSDFLETVEED